MATAASTPPWIKRVATLLKASPAAPRALWQASSTASFTSLSCSTCATSFASTRSSLPSSSSKASMPCGLPPGCGFPCLSCFSPKTPCPSKCSTCTPGSFGLLRRARSIRKVGGRRNSSALVPASTWPCTSSSSSRAVLRGSMKPASSGRAVITRMRSGGSKLVWNPPSSCCGRRRIREIGLRVRSTRKPCSSCSSSQGKLNARGISLAILTWRCTPGCKGCKRQACSTLTAKHLVIQPLAQFREQCFDLLAPLKKLLVGPLPVLREIPAYLLALLRCERVRQQVTLVLEPQLVAAQFYACDGLGRSSGRRWCERD